MTQQQNTSDPFPKRLKKARLAAGYTQFALGVAAGIDEYSASPRINQYERGVHSPDKNMASRLAHVLDVPLSYLLEPNENLAELIFLAGRLGNEDLLRLTSYLKEALKE
jgi:transcriptional regulator with XRE-family HTH domain